MINEAAIDKLLQDLRSPPKDFPVFNMDYNLILDEDGEWQGDISAYLAARALGGPEKMYKFVINGGDVFAKALEYSGMLPRQLGKLVFPEELLEIDYPMHTISRTEAIILVETFRESGWITPDYLEIVDDVDTAGMVNTQSEIATRVDQFIKRYGGRPRS